MVFNSGVPAKAIAEELRKPYTTLLRELNPDDDGCKVGADILIPLMQICNGIDPLRYQASATGNLLVPLSCATPDKPTLSEEMNDDLQAVAQYHSGMLNGLPLEKVEMLLEQAKAELEENFVLYRRLSVKRAG